MKKSAVILVKQKAIRAAAILGAASLVAFSLIIPGSSSNLSPQTGHNNQSSNEQMPATDTLPFDFDAAWNEIDSLASDGLPKSALEKTTILLESARKEARNADFVKAQLYRGRFITELEEDGLDKAILLLAAETEESAFPVRQLLHSIMAELLSSYLSDNLYKLEDRTETQAPPGEDLSTWGIGQLQREIFRHFEASLDDERLKQSDIEQFSVLLTPGQLDENLRPTLYDFLAHRAIDHFMNERSHLTQPAYAFVMNDMSALKPAAEFVKWKIQSRDTASYKLKALLLFQELLGFRLSQAGGFSAALLDADLKRIEFVSRNAAFEGSDAATMSALESLRSDFKGRKEVAEVYHKLASRYLSQGREYSPPPFGQPDTGDRKWYFKEALERCDEAIADYPGTPGAAACAGLRSHLLGKSLKIHAEDVNLPQSPLLLKVDYANIDKFRMKVVRMDDKRRDALSEAQMNSHSAMLAYLNGLPALRTLDFSLPDDGDLREHSAEVKLDGLPPGQFALVFSAGGNLSSAQDNGHLLINVSNLGAWKSTHADGSNLVVFDRRTGSPLPGVLAEFWSRQYDYGTSKLRKSKKTTSLKSNGEGFIELPPSVYDDNFQVILRHQKDTLLLGNNFFYRGGYRAGHESEWTGFFLDRAIYRPGQTVFFKGIALRFDERRRPKVIQQEKVTVTLVDANWQEVSKLQLVTNEYGTFNGSFTAPRTGLTGQMHINSTIGGQSKYFRVEEYKRPKFSVSFQPVAEAIRLNDQVAVNGSAQAYAGSPVDGATVAWRVVREARFPWYRWWLRGGFPQRSPAMEIASGLATTDASGAFKVSFKAIPDLKIPAADKPEFTYSVTADVTDINGETQSGKATVVAGYVAMNMELSAAGKPLNESGQDASRFKEIEISSKNLNGQFEPARGTLSISLLKSPAAAYKDRLWEIPDRRAIPEKDFKALFPDIAWAGEDKVQNWPVSQEILSAAFDTEKSGKFQLPAGKLKPGWYLFTLATADRFGEKVEARAYFNVFANKGAGLPAPAVCMHNQGASADGDDRFEPGEIAGLFFASSMKKQHVLVEMEKEGELLLRKWLLVNDLHKLDFSVLESHRGNVNYSYSFARGNRSFNKRGILAIPWSNKDLTLSYGTFRDKLAPGQEEEWVVTIKGPKNEKVAAEMAVAMYDLSLDAFAPNSWDLKPWPVSSAWSSCESLGYDETVAAIPGNQDYSYYQESINRTYRELNWFNWSPRTHYFSLDFGEDRVELLSAAPTGAVPKGRAARTAAPAPAFADSAEPAQSPAEDGAPPAGLDFSAVDVRSNLNETVFFYPRLMTDTAGNVVVRFTMNEALTKWKFLALAHTRDLQTATSTREVVTRKDLMVVPNPPRFLRENDVFEFSAKVVNMTDTALSGEAKLELVNAITGEKLKWVSLSASPERQRFTVAAGQSRPLLWRIKVPDVTLVPALEHTVLAMSGDFSDAERNAAPVLTNRMLVTESLPLPARGGQTREFVFKALKDNTSPTLKHESFTLEFTQNPAWYAVQALPYLMEYPHECSEQVFSRYFANSLASTVANRYPRIREVFDRWRSYEPAALESNLMKNQELKTALLEETPWVLQAQDEKQRKHNIALLFDMNTMSYNRESALARLRERQLPSGAWSWFSGGPESWFITQHIAAGMGHLRKLGAQSPRDGDDSAEMTRRAVAYCDQMLLQGYRELERAVKDGKAKWEDDHLGYMPIHYLYMRSFHLMEIEAGPELEKARRYYLDQARRYWSGKGLALEAMLALALDRSGDAAAALRISRSLKERSLQSEELGMYWKYPAGWWWHQAPIETHSLLIEVFNEVARDAASVENLKIWLLKNKQTTDWKTTKATSQAVYALLSTGENWLGDNQPVAITVGGPGSRFASNFNNAVKAAQRTAESGTGYFKARVPGREVSGDLATVKVSNPNRVVTWGALYWQYFEQLDRIKSFEETPLKIQRQLFRMANTPSGEVLQPLKTGESYKVGDKIKVRIELRVDRDMEYVHMKDMRAGGFEPVNVLSSYKWQGGLGYFENTRDAATNFFFPWLPKGTYVFEYPLRATYRGDFSTGTTTIQCMYAPEFTSHSEGGRVTVE